MTYTDSLTSDDALAKKLRWRLLPMLFLLYVVAYLDRINIGFAALNMNRELALSSQQYGFLSGIFFCGYFLFEIPSNLILHRVGACKWFARILITWGMIAILTGFVQNAPQLYVARFLLGVAEAGFFPGILYYLTLWFRQREQALAVGLFIASLPTASIVGGPLSGLILDHVQGFGLSSWRWLLILEALPAIAGGILTYRFLPNRPSEATFLSAAEKMQLHQSLAEEAASKLGDPNLSVLQTLMLPRILHLAGIHFFYLMGLYVTGFWMPQSIKAVGAGFSNTTIGLLVMIPNIVCVATMTIVARSSDRRNERHWHAAVSLLVAAAGLFFVAQAPSLTLRLSLWCLVASGLGSYIAPFYACISGFVSGRAAASALAFINSFGSLGSFFSLSLIGAITTRTGSMDGGFHIVAIGLAFAAVLLLAHKLHRQNSLATPARDQSPAPIPEPPLG